MEGQYAGFISAEDQVHGRWAARRLSPPEHSDRPGRGQSRRQDCDAFADTSRLVTGIHSQSPAERPSRFRDPATTAAGSGAQGPEEVHGRHPRRPRGATFVGSLGEVAPRYDNVPGGLIYSLIY